jgi:hypothetical protein
MLILHGPRHSTLRWLTDRTVMSSVVKVHPEHAQDLRESLFAGPVPIILNIVHTAKLHYFWWFIFGHCPSSKRYCHPCEC